MLLRLMLLDIYWKLSQWLWTIEDFLNLIQNSNIIYLCYVNTKLDKDEETILINFSGLKEQGVNQNFDMAIYDNDVS